MSSMYSNLLCNVFAQGMNRHQRSVGVPFSIRTVVIQNVYAAWIRTLLALCNTAHVQCQYICFFLCVMLNVLFCPAGERRFILSTVPTVDWVLLGSGESIQWLKGASHSVQLVC